MISKNLKYIIGLFIFVSFASAELNINGYLKGYSYVNPNDLTYSELGTRLKTTFSGDMGRTASYYAGINFQLDEFSDSGSREFSLFPVEYYMDMQFDKIDFRVGQQYIFWGTGSWINPTDKINPWNYERINAEIEDYRIPVWAFNMQYYWNQFTLQTVLIPGFQPAILPLPNYTVVSPDNTIENTQVAVKLLSYLGQTDFSLSYYKGFDAFPTFNVMMGAMGSSFFYTYLPVYMLGADFARSFDAMTLKGEFAYNHHDDESGEDITITNSNLNYVLGLDYSFSDRLSANIQYSGIYLLDYDIETERDHISDAGMSSYISADEVTSHTLSGMLNFDVFKYTKGQVLGVVNMKDMDSFVMGFISWELLDAVNLIAGTVLFQGIENSTFGKSAEKDKVFIELKMSF